MKSVDIMIHFWFGDSNTDNSNYLHLFHSNNKEDRMQIVYNALQ